MSATSFPLSWPPGVPRARTRERGSFRSTFVSALSNVRVSLTMFAKDSGKALANVVLSSNVGGLSMTDDAPRDPGIAVWFTWDGLDVCIAVDRYDTPAATLQAVHHIVEARRVELRHGTLAMVRASFTGFKAIAPPAGKSWRDILKLPAGTVTVTAADIDAAFKAQAAIHHPDKGGSIEFMTELNEARAVGKREIGG